MQRGRFIDPTGTYMLVARSYSRDGERYGRIGEMAVDLINSSTRPASDAAGAL